MIKGSVALAQAQQVPLVATNNVRFCASDEVRADFEAHETRVAIGQGFALDDKRRPRSYKRDSILEARRK